MLRSTLPSPTVASLLRIVLAIVLATIALKVTAKRFDQFASRYDAYDFDVFYDWGNRYRTGADAWAKDEGGVVRHGQVRPVCNQTPAFEAAFAPLTLLDQRVAHSVWLVAQLVFLALALTLVAREIDPPLYAATFVMFIAVALMFRSVRLVMLNAGFGPTLLLPIVISWKCSRRRRPVAAGLSLAFAALMKLYPVALAGYFLLRKRWSVLWWTAAFFLIGVVASGIANWWKLRLSREYTISEITRFSKNHVALLPSVYAWCASLGVGGAPRWVVVIAVTVILDIGIMAVLFWETSRAANDSISDGLVLSLWLIAVVLLSPLAWRGDLVMLFPAYIFTLVAASRVSIEGRVFTGMGFAAGAILIGFCAVAELRKSGDFRPQTMTALLTFIGTAIILRSWIDAEEPVRQPDAEISPGSLSAGV